MKLSKKEKEILTYFEDGVRKKGVIKKLQWYFGYRLGEIKKIFNKLKKEGLIDEIKGDILESQLLIVSKKVKRCMLDDEVKYLLSESSEYKTFKDFLKNKRK